ncbi:ArsR/SmtB family transcription factor [Actinoplanes regularis]|uniref:Regulatory protein, arsR family n=1 Tax=Actinoplanes regularis TaxID=52697 RepID=A0A238X5L9_9ACTN|nr:ArsR family transcriptional regulator [Actinoplanes regularis]GIE86445.1 transcriptional regulator [Actinoplanes regularis]SNR53932.1 regulatory protein, arsR family [Actinoplanes regularis]
MIHVEVSNEALGDLRIVVSPIWEAFASLSMLAWGRVSPWPYSEWGRKAERAVQRRPGAELVAWIRRLHGVVPNVLTPVPEGEQSIEDEVKTLVDQLTELPDAHLRAVMTAAGPTTLHPEAWLRWLPTAILDYWEAALAPYWDTVGTALRADVLTRAHMLASEGVTNALAGFDRRIRWNAPVLELPTAVPSCRLRCADRLVLVPQIFGRRTTRCVLSRSGSVAVTYQAQGAGALGTLHSAPRQATSARSHHDRLGLMVGRGKAAVLRGLAQPTTTSELAQALGMSPSTISEHLSTMVAADVVRKQRSGARVIYVLQGAGVALLRYLDAESKARPPISLPRAIDADPNFIDSNRSQAAE